MSDGWKCPVCNRGVAPDEKNCDHGGQAQLMPYYIPYPQPYPVYPQPYWPLAPYHQTPPWPNIYWQQPYYTGLSATQGGYQGTAMAQYAATINGEMTNG